MITLPRRAFATVAAHSLAACLLTACAASPPASFASAASAASVTSVAAATAPASPPGATQAAPAKCTTEDYRRFDFWLGAWEVRDAAGKLEGTNVITREYDGCVIQEHWTSAEDPQFGSSFSGYDFRTKQWYHSWADNWGNYLLLQGGWASSGMSMQGERLTPKGERALERTIWAPLPGGKVRQYWDYSLDGGRTWKPRFEGIYTRKPS